MLKSKLEKKINDKGIEYYYCYRCKCVTLIQSLNKCKVFDTSGYIGEYIMNNVKLDLENGSCPSKQCDDWLLL